MAIAYLLCVASILAVSSAAKNTISFTALPAPVETSFNHVGFTDAVINGKRMKFKFTPLLESGKVYPSFTAGQSWTAGTILDKNGVALTTSDHPDADPALARDFDRTSFIEAFGKLWAITQNEDEFGNLYLLELAQSKTGVLTIKKAKTMNLGPVYGLGRPCSGYMTQWNTHLGGEELLVETRGFPSATPNVFLVKQAIVNRLPIWSDVNPYWYGWAFEAAITSSSGSYWVKKRYAMGRVWWETAVTFKDRKTVLGMDDVSSGGVLLLFVADKAGDLSSGKLFAALPIQLNAADGGSFKFKWLALNPDRTSVRESTVANAISGANYAAAPVKFADLFDVATVLPNTTNPDISLLPAGFKVVNTLGNRYEWLKLKPGMGGLASCMETHRMAAYVGASVEFTKAEGATYDAKNNLAYIGVANIQRAMRDKNGVYDLGGPNAIRLPSNVAGAVYKLTLGKFPGVSPHAPLRMRAVINGFGFSGNSSQNNSVPFESIASPDNVDLMHSYGKLLIGEDCGSQHVNNHMWAYDLESGQLDRIFYSSYDAEVTSPYYFANFGKFSYITATSQHPRMQDVPATVGYWVLPAEK